jgi:hypothetical protein
VNFRGGTAGFVRMKFERKRVQNSVIRVEIRGNMSCKSWSFRWFLSAFVLKSSGCETRLGQLLLERSAANVRSRNKFKKDLIKKDL